MKKLFVLGIAALLLVAFAVPATAEVKIGGIIFTDFYYIDRSKDNMFNPTFGRPNATSYTTTAIQVPNITRLYARWTNEDNVGMYIELGLGQGSGGVDTSSSDNDFSVVVRHAYGWWDVNPMFQIMAGHSTTPFSPLNPSQLLGTRSGSVNIIGVGYGDYYAGRFVQIRGTFKFGKVARLEIALVDPNGTQAGGTNATYNQGPFGPWAPTSGTFAGYTNNTTIPRIDVGVPIYLGPVHLYPGIMWQRRGVDNAFSFLDRTQAIDDNITTWIGSLGAKAGFGPFSISGEFNYGQNWENTRGLAGVSAPATLAFASVKSTGAINNADTYSWWVDLAYKFGPVTPTLIYGQMKTKNLIGTALLGDVDIEAKSQMYGISIPIDLAKGFRLRPEFMWYDDGDLSLNNVSGNPSTSLGKYVIMGVQFQITF